MYYVYILKCKDGGMYTGCTKNLQNRLERHNKKQVLATASRIPLVLVSYVAMKEKHKAYKFEKYLKSGSGRAFIKKHIL